MNEWKWTEFKPKLMFSINCKSSQSWLKLTSDSYTLVDSDEISMQLFDAYTVSVLLRDVGSVRHIVEAKCRDMTRA